MSFGPHHPLAIRREFKQKALMNYAVVAAGFVLVVAGASAFLSPIWPGFFPLLSADAVSLGLAYICLKGLEGREIGFSCTKCKKWISVNTPWVCGVCGASNSNVDVFPFCNRCESCTDLPKAYKCHHVVSGDDDVGSVPCENLNFLSQDRQETNYAYCLQGKSEASVSNKHEEKMRKRKEQSEEKEQKIALALLDAKLKAARATVKVPVVKSPRERMQEDFDKSMGALFSSEDIAAAQIAELEKDPKFENDPSGKERRKEWINNWARRNIQ